MMTNENLAAGLDDVLKKLGPFGKYTVYNYALLILPCFLNGLFSSAYNFEAMDINYRCGVPECEDLNDTKWLEYALPQEKVGLSKCRLYQYNNDTTNKCSIEAFNTTIVQECDVYVYSDQDSVVKDFNLGCQNWKRTFIGTVHHFGFFIALPLTAVISDRYGRTIAISLASLMNGIFGIARSFSTTYTTMLILEFLETALGAGHSTSAFVMAIEFVEPRRRALGITLMNFSYIIGMVILTALAWWLQNWRNLLRIIFAPAFIPAFYFIILKESPRWLISKGSHQKAKEVLRNAAKMNKVEIPEDMLNSVCFINNNKETDTAKINEYTHSSVNIEKQKTDPSLFRQIIKSKIIMTRLVICSYLWMSGTFIYYGLSINSVSLDGNKYLNFMMISLVEIPAVFMVFFLLNRHGRKRTLSSTFLLSGCMCIGLSLLAKDQSKWSLILYLVGKFFASMAYSSVYVYVSEVFPTNIRQTLFSFCSTVGRVGTTLAPLTPLLALYNNHLSAIVFGGVALTASVITLILPETINVTLPNTIEEAEKISKMEV